MPVSMKRLRRDEPLQQALWDSWKLRRPSIMDTLSNDGDNPINQLLAQDQLCLQALKEVENLRQLRKSKKDPEATASLAEKERHLKQLHHELDEQLNSIPNLVDTGLKDIWRHQEEQSPKTIPIILKNPPPEGVDDVLFCIGGYESFSMPQQSQSPTVPVWTTVGMDLNRVVERAWDQWLHQQQQKALHASILDQQEASQDTTSSPWKQWRFPATIDTPGWQMILHSLKGETMYDRSLPQCHFFYGKKGDALLAQQSTSTAKSKKKKSKLAWLDDIESNAVEVLILTGPSLSVDSRPLQLQWLHNVIEFYASLLHGTTGNDNSNLHNMNDLFDVYIVPPDQLKSCESSKIILYGKLPQVSDTSKSKQSSSNDSRIALASLSNLQEYESGDIRHGNSTLRSGHNQYNTATLTAAVQVIQGTLCRTANTVAWMAAWNAQSRGLVLPPSLAKMYKKTGPVDPSVSVSTHHATIPYVRRVRTNAKGKRSVENFDVTNQAKKKGNKKECGTRLGAVAQPSVEQIRMERLTCPFFFLPFHGQGNEDTN